MRILAIRHACEQMRSHARSLNPLARGFLISSDGNFHLRHYCARMRLPNIGAATHSLTVASPLIAQPSMPSNNQMVRQRSEPYTTSTQIDILRNGDYIR